eukprot:1346581-Amphidinium_carterae.1
MTSRINTQIESMARNGIFATGRLVMRWVCREYELDSDHSSLYDVNDLMQLRVCNATPEGIKQYLELRAWVEQGLRNRVDHDVKESILFYAVKDIKILEPDLILYSPYRCYSYLQHILEKYCRRVQQESSRAELLKSLQTVGGGAGQAFPAVRLRATPQGRGKQSGAKNNQCRFYARGVTCKFGDKCKYARSGPVRARSSSQGTASSGGGDAKCLSFLKTGKCRFGDRCKFAHTSADASVYMASSMRAGSSSQVYTCTSIDGVFPCSCGCTGGEAGKVSASAHVCYNHDVVFRATDSDGDFKGGMGKCRKWIVDSGAGLDLSGESCLTDSESSQTRNSGKPIHLTTANGKTTADRKAPCPIEVMNVELQPLILPQCPPVMSVGRRVIKDGFSFVWNASEPQRPYLIDPCGNKIALGVEGYVPILCEDGSIEEKPKPGLVAHPAQVMKESSAMRVVHGHALSGNEDPSSGHDVEESDDRADIHDDDDDDLDDEGLTKSKFLRVGRTREAAESTLHQMMHYLKNNFCPCCRGSKAISSPARRIRAGQERLKATKFGQVIHIDHLVVSEDFKGVGGERVALVVLDQFTGFGGAYPATSKSSEEIVIALRHFVGGDAEWRNVSLKADNSMESACAAKTLGVARFVSTPHHHQSNGKIERFIRRLVESSRASLDQAGLPVQCWPLAIRHAAHCPNVMAPSNEEGECAWDRRTGEPCEWKAYPFGTKVSAIIRAPASKPSKFEPSGTECVFVGWNFAPGWIHSDYQVMIVSQVRDSFLPHDLHVHRTREVVLGENSNKCDFPLKSQGMGSTSCEGPVHVHVPVENVPFRLVHDGEADDRTLKGVAEGLGGGEDGERLPKVMRDKGWRVDRFGDRLVRTPPGSSRLAQFTPEEWRELPLKVRRALALDAAGKREAETAEVIGQGGSSGSGGGNPALACGVAEKDRRGVWFAGDLPTATRFVGDLTAENVKRVVDDVKSGCSSRVIVELCCDGDSKLGTHCRQGCSLLRVTEAVDVCSKRSAQLFKDICVQLGERVFVWVSCPCTSGCTWHRTNPSYNKSAVHIKKLRHHEGIAETCLGLIRFSEGHNCQWAWEWPRHNDMGG